MGTYEREVSTKVQTNIREFTLKYVRFFFELFLWSKEGTGGARNYVTINGMKQCFFSRYYSYSSYPTNTQNYIFDAHNLYA